MKRQITIKKWQKNSGWNYEEVILDHYYMNDIWGDDDTPEEIIKAEADAIFEELYANDSREIEEVKNGDDYVLTLQEYEEDEYGYTTSIQDIEECWLSEWLAERGE